MRADFLQPSSLRRAAVMLLAGSCPQFRGPPRSTTSLQFDRVRQANLADRQREEALSFYQRDCAFGLRMMWHNTTRIRMAANVGGEL